MLRVVAKAAGGTALPSLRVATMAYFAVAIAACAGTAAMYALWLRRLPLYLECKREAAHAAADAAQRTDHLALSGDSCLAAEAALLAAAEALPSDRAAVDRVENADNIGGGSIKAAMTAAKGGSAQASAAQQFRYASDAAAREPLVATGAVATGAHSRTESATLAAPVLSIAGPAGHLGVGQNSAAQGAPSMPDQAPASDAQDATWPEHLSQDRSRHRGSNAGAGWRHTGHERRAPEWWHVLRLIAVPTASLFCVYLVTLAIFPGFLSEDVKSEALGSWYPVLLFLVFAAADCASRWLPVPPKWCLPASLTR